MSVRQSLLAILDQGPCYGYQLRAEFERRTGSAWPLNVGQIYNTLERLERDGLVEKGAVDEQGHVYYGITAAGREAARGWLGAPVPSASAVRDELPIKLALAATLPGVDVADVVRRQRDTTLAVLDDLRRAQGATPDPSDGEGFARQLIADARLFRAEAEARWLDEVLARLRRQDPHRRELAINVDRPRRGRPPRRGDSAA